jgi:tyrosine-protein kinase Tec
MIPTEFSPLHVSTFFVVLQKRRERGRIDVRGIKLVEPAILHGDGGDASAPNVSVANLMTVDLPQSSRLCSFPGLSVPNWILRIELHNRRKQYTADIHALSRRGHR